VPVQPAGRTGLFSKPEAQLFGKTYSWLVDYGWSDTGYGERPVPADDEIFAGYVRVYGLTPQRAQAVRARLTALKASVPSAERPVNLVSFLHPELSLAGP
jgi:DNA helicase-2/ATP-dependent DNA helicase PcrA